MDDLQECETFLRATLSLEGKQASVEMWEQCRRHEWHAYEWDIKKEEIVLRNPLVLPVVDLKL